MKLAQVTVSRGNWYELKDEHGNHYSARLRGRHKQTSKRYTNPVAVGDYAYLEETEHGEWVIDRVAERERYLVRRSSNLSRKYQVIAANLDQLFLIVTVNHPHTPLGFVDRILVMAEKAGIPSTIILNKIDCFEGKDLERLEELNDIYTSIGYKCIKTSLTRGDGLEDLKKALKGKTTLLVGNSGVGKSTFLNIMVPEAEQKTSELSDSYGKGKHTTTFATMFENEGVRIVDTPGIKEFGLVDVDESNLSNYFPEFSRAAEACRFSNCKHLKEPDCEVLRLLEDGELAESRYRAYYLMHEELKA
jgi:ribosome biogenesis GTPase / thiamine phosphate phosphatase